LEKTMFSRRNLLILAIVVLLAAVGGAYYWQQRLAAERAAREAIRREVVARGDIMSIVSATGSLQPEAEVNLFFTAASPLPVQKVNVTVGQAVKKGDVLAQLDPSDLELSVRQAEQALASADLALAQLLAPPRPEDIAAAEANLRLAKAQVYAASLGSSPESVQIAYLNLRIAQNSLNTTYATMDQLVAQGKWAEKNALQDQADQQVEAAQIADLRYHQAQQPPNPSKAAAQMGAVEQAQAALDRLKQGPSDDDLEIARRQVSQARAALELAQNNLRDAQIVAPFDGVAAAVNIRVGEPAPGGLPAIVLADVSRFHLVVFVDEVDVARVVPGQPVSVTLDALPDRLFSGRLDRVAPAATVNAGVVSYAVRINLAPTDAPARAGMTATADIVVDEARDVVLVPNWAIRRDRDTGQAFVGVLREGRIEDVPVELGLRNETFSQVIRGVNAGDVVAVSTAREQFSLFGGGE
jgi:HlyD family secretion protein